MALFLAYLYLFSYELDWVERVIARERRDLYEAFMYMGRFLDDLISVLDCLCQYAAANILYMGSSFTCQVRSLSSVAGSRCG